MKIPCGGFELNSDDFKFNDNGELSLYQSGDSGGDSGYEVREMVVVPEQTIVVDDPEFGQYDVALTDGAYEFLMDNLNNESQYLKADIVFDGTHYDATILKEGDVDISITYDDSSTTYIQCYITYTNDDSISAEVACSISGEHTILINASNIIVSAELKDIIRTETDIIYVDYVYDASTQKVTLIPSAKYIAQNNHHTYYLRHDSDMVYRYHGQSIYGITFQYIDINIDKLYVYELLVNFDGTFSETSKTYDLSTLLEANSK
ncbi:MAG: hypothetical protein IJA72_01125 [Clostridia bacterium]|nr:hypothetical protein [Clostridia bacterium]